MKKFAIFTVMVIAIAICISIYSLSESRIAFKNEDVSSEFNRNRIAEAFREVLAAPEAGSNAGSTQLMARAIYGEARGEPYIGQVAVGAVILNRVNDSRFPNTIAGVIYQPGAFTAVSDGQINLPLDPSNTAYKAASDAMNGWDPTNGCVYYFNPATATSSWIWGRPQATTIGKHIFAK